MMQERAPRLVPAVISISFHAAVLAAILTHRIEQPKLIPEPNFIVTLDTLSAAVAPAGDVLPTPATVAPIPPAPIAEASETAVEQQVAAASSEQGIAAAVAVEQKGDAPAEVSPNVPSVSASEAAPVNAAPHTPPSTAMPSPSPEQVGTSGNDVPPDQPPASEVPDASASPPATAVEAPEQTSVAAATVAPNLAPTGATPAELQPLSSVNGVPEQATADAVPLAPPADVSVATGGPRLPDMDVPVTTASGGAPPIEAARPAAPEAAVSSTAPAKAVEATPPPSIHSSPQPSEVPGQSLSEPEAAKGPVLAEVEPTIPADAEPEAPVTSAPSTMVEGGPDRTVPVPPAVPPMQTAKLEAGPSVAAIHTFVESYDGGPCFFASVARATSNGAAIDAFSSEKPTFQTLNDAFKSKLGLEPDVLGQRVWAAQCSAVEFLQRTRNSGTPLQLEVDRRDVSSGDIVSGTIEGVAADQLSLYMVDENGKVSELSQYIRKDANSFRFSARVDHSGRGGPFPALLIAVSGAMARLGAVDDIFRTPLKATPRPTSAAAFLRVTRP